jgi:hypothetical protein
MCHHYNAKDIGAKLPHGMTGLRVQQLKMQHLLLAGDM